jgi:hypothetical protein
VEVLVAVSIFSVLIVTVYASFMNGISARRKGDNIVTLAETAQNVVGRLSTELASCLAYSHASFSGRSEEIAFITLKAPAKGGDTQICRITYYTHGGSGTPLRSLHRACEPLGCPCLEGDLSGPCIRHLEMSYAFGGQGAEEIEWYECWIGTGDKPLPLAVRIRLVLESGDETLEVERVMPVPVSAALEGSVASSI